jgi:hypothetical protein
MTSIPSETKPATVSMKFAGELKAEPWLFAA